MPLLELKKKKIELLELYFQDMTLNPALLADVE